MIRQLPLGKVIGANALATIAAPDHRFSGRRDLGALFFLFLFKQAGAQNLHPLGAVLMLRLLVLARNDYTGGNMGDSDRGIGGIYALAAWTGGTEDIHAKLLRIDGDFHFVGFRQHRDGYCRSVNPTRPFGHGHALHAVHATLEFKPAVSTVPFDARDDFLVTAEAGRIGTHHFDTPTTRFGVTAVHAEKLGGKQGRLIAAG